jgi:hypothetical protein
MKKSITILFSFLAVSILSLAVISPAQAAEPNRGGPWGDKTSSIPGRNAGLNQEDGMSSQENTPLQMNLSLDGILEDYMHEAMAKILEISPEELSELENGGESFIEIALSKGYELSEARDLMVEARADALAQAVADGVLTQEDADWFASRGSRGPRDAAEFRESGRMFDCDPEDAPRGPNTR